MMSKDFSATKDLSATTFLNTKPKTEPVKETPKQSAEEQIRLAAYFRWEQAGAPIGEDERFWLEAEQELRQQELI